MDTGVFDTELGLVVLGVALITGLAVYFVSIVGVKEKSFEEAIAEQKKRSEELLGVAKVKPKSIKKEKKNKPNVNKRIKHEKITDHELNQENDIGEEEVNVKHHVEIQEEPEFIDPLVHSRRPSTISATQIKSILMNKQEMSPVSDSSIPQINTEVNHFDIIHPKDDFYMKKRTPSTSSLEEEKTLQTDSKNLNQLLAQTQKKQQKKQQKEGLTLPKLIQSLETLTLSTNEIQSLIDTLLDKQTTSEWTNKNKDSVANLKKQLTTIETQLSEEQLTVVNLQKILKELRAEYSQEKTKYSKEKRLLEENLNVKQSELNNIQQRLRQMGDIANSEKENLNKQMREISKRFKEVNEELEGVKAEYRNSVNSDGGFRAKSESLEREIGALKTQYGHQGNQLSSAFQSNEELTKQVLQLQHNLHQQEKQKQELLLNFQKTLSEKEQNFLSEIKTLQQHLTESEKEKTSLRHLTSTANENYKKSLNELQLKVEDTERSEKNMRNLLEDARFELKEVKQKLEDAKKAVSTLEEVNRGNQSKVCDQEVNLLRVKIEGLVKEKEELSKEISNNKDKNDELRLKNVKLLESLKLTEKQLEKKLEDEIKLTKIEQNIRDTFHNHFPHINIDKSSEWAEKLAVRLQEEAANNNKSNQDDHQIINDLQTQILKLTSEVTHYQLVLAKTESLLETLQGSIEKEEAKWIIKLQEKDQLIQSLNLKAQVSYGPTPSSAPPEANEKSQITPTRTNGSSPVVIEATSPPAMTPLAVSQQPIPASPSPSGASSNSSSAPPQTTPTLEKKKKKKGANASGSSSSTSLRREK